MHKHTDSQLILLEAAGAARRAASVAEIMRSQGVGTLLAGDNANLYYLTGRVFCGYAQVNADGSLRCYVRRPSVLAVGDAATPYKRFDELVQAVTATMAPGQLALSLDDTPYSTIERLCGALIPGGSVANASAILRRARAVKTPEEIEALELSGRKQTAVYRRIPSLYRPGMSDIELQIEIERALRLEGCLGQFRCAGAEMEIFMGNVLTGDNADSPSPYDFAMGGAGLDPSLPVGADGSIIEPGKPVMVDMNGNFTGYMTDMTRCFIAGTCPPQVRDANRLSADICAAIAGAARPGAAAKDLYAIAHDMVKAAGMEHCFMGHTQQAGFVGHGVGITINELPVIAPRSKDILAAGNVIALEPKFVLPGLGAIGVENTYVVQEHGPARCITTAPQEVVAL